MKKLVSAKKVAGIAARVEFAATVVLSRRKLSRRQVAALLSKIQLELVGLTADGKAAQ